MKRVLTFAAILSVAAAGAVVLGQGQGQAPRFSDPFFDHSDTGDIVKVLPTPALLHKNQDLQPTDAPPSNRTTVYPASYGSTGVLLNHGGPQMTNAGFFAIFWNDQVAKSKETSVGLSYSTLGDEIQGFVTAFSDGGNYDNSNGDDYTVIQQYGSTSFISPSFQFIGSITDTQPTQSQIKDSAIQSHLRSLFNSGRLIPSESVLFGVYLPPGMKVSLQGMSCSSFCGYHGYFNYAGLAIKYAAFPYLNCSACSLTGKTVADMMTIVTSHEIREAVTDPLLNAWYDSVGYEADDKCAWHNLYQMTFGGFWVQPEFSNGGTVNRSGFTATYPGPGCVVPNR